MAVSGAKAIFGASNGSRGDLVDASIRGVGNWIDEQQWTDEEKAKYRAEVIAKYGEWFSLTMGENTERSIARRAIAIWVIRLEGLFLIASVALYKVDQGLAEYTYRVATDSPWGLLTLGVGAFFFGTHLVRAAK